MSNSINNNLDFKVLIVENNISDRALICKSIIKAYNNSIIKFAENMQDALTLSSLHYFDFILLESTIADNVNITALKRLYISRSYMPCVILLIQQNNRQCMEMKHPGVGGCILKKEMSSEAISRCFNNLIELRIPGIIQPLSKGKTNISDKQSTISPKQQNPTSGNNSKPQAKNNSMKSLPQSSTKQPDRPGKMVKIKPSWSHLNILVAEDNDINRFIIEKMMKSLGANITLTADGKEAMSQFSKCNFDMVFLDIEMPNLNGYETTMAIRNGLKNKDVPIIAMTGHIQKEEKEKCLQSGMNDVISKPFDEKVLKSVFEKWEHTSNTSNNN